MSWVIAPAIAAAFVLLTLVVRSSLIGLRESVQESWAGLDALLLERHDRLEDLVDLGAQHLRYDADALERVERADDAAYRAAARTDIPALAAAEQILRAAIANLLALAENYPALAADAAFLALRERIQDLGAAILERRERYNCAVNLLNIRSQAFPHRMIARALGFRSEALFE